MDAPARRVEPGDAAPASFRRNATYPRCARTLIAPTVVPRIEAAWAVLWPWISMTILLVNVFGVTSTPARPAGYSREKNSLAL
jgi:hypothetical protein